MPDKLPGVPEFGAGDVAHIGAKGFLGLISGLGVVYEVLVEPFMRRNVERFQEAMRTEVESLGEKFAVAEADRKIDHELVLSIMVEAAAIAARTRLEEKRSLLAKAVVNAAVYGLDGYDERLLLHWLDVLSLKHFEVLTHHVNPERCMERRGKSYPPNAMSSSHKSAFDACHPEFEPENPGLWEILAAELQSFGLMAGNFGGTMTKTGWKQSLATQRGRQLVRFVYGPDF